MTEPSPCLAALTPAQLSALDAMTGGKASTFRTSDEPTPTTRTDPIVARAIERTQKAMTELVAARDVLVDVVYSTRRADYRTMADVEKRVSDAIAVANAAALDLCATASTAVRR